MTSSVLASALLVFIRTSSFVAFLPPVAGKSIPVQAKAVIAVALAICWWQRVLQWHLTGEISTVMTVPSFALYALLETAIGVGLAWIAGSLLTLASSAGSVLADGMGLNMDSISSVLETGSGTSLSQLLETLLGMLLFVLNIHHVFILLLDQSFMILPVGQMSQFGNAEHGIRWYTLTGTAPVLLILPAVAVSLCVLLVISVSMRQSPQFNLLSYGMPLRLLLGMSTLTLLLPTLLSRCVLLVRGLCDQILSPDFLGQL